MFRSAMGLTVLLKYPATLLCIFDPSSEIAWSRVIYLDERNLVVTNARDAETVMQTGNRFSQDLGLVENRRKLRVLTKDVLCQAEATKAPEADQARQILSRLSRSR